MIRESYEARTPKSREAHRRLSKVMPGGDSRSTVWFAPYPVVLTGGYGAEVRDLDGNQYLDLLNNYTSTVHGHAHPRIVDAVTHAVNNGSAFPAPHSKQGDLAELLVNRYPAVEHVRFTNSGTEAAILAARLARRATGRREIVMFEGGYHGGSSLFIDQHPDVMRLPYNDISALENISNKPAAIFVEPFLGSGGVIPAETEFLAAVQNLARRAGAVFVLDEVQALRNQFSGMHHSLGLQPDLVLMGKIIGGGLPVGAVGGIHQLLELLDAGRVDALSHPGTFNGNSVTVEAGIASLQLLTEDRINELNSRSSLFAREIERMATEKKINLQVTRSGSILQAHFMRAAPVRYETPSIHHRTLAMYWHLALLENGILIAPRGMFNLSTVLTGTQIDATLERFSAAMDTLRKDDIAAAVICA